MKKERIVVICPGRGTYTKDTLGYLKPFGAKIGDFIRHIDERRRSVGEPTISELDNADTFKPQLHTKGEHASTLIYSCSYADFASIDRDRYEIVAVTGNSMGWYITLALGEALDRDGSFDVINTMGSMMKEEIIGGQVIYPIVDEQWNISSAREKELLQIVEKLKQRDGVEAHLSIRLGGYMVFGANKAGIAALLKELPKIDDYPFQLINHAAFHTPLLEVTSQKAFQLLPQNLFRKPKVPLIDGRGHIWQPYATDLRELYQYTLGHQVVAPYDFTAAVSVALKEFAPDRLVLLGPGGSLGGSIGQILVKNNWKGISAKSDFARLQKSDPFLLSMGIPEQRRRLATS